MSSWFVSTLKYGGLVLAVVAILPEVAADLAGIDQPVY